MRCPKCGNEISQDEAFCGQCGSPTRPIGQHTEMVQAPRSGLLKTFNQNNSPLPEAASNPYYSGPASPNQGPSMVPPNPTPLITPANSLQQTGFYQSATEAMSSVPTQSGQSQPINYPQTGYAGPPSQAGYPATAQYGPPPQVQTYQTGNPTQHGYPAIPPYPGPGGQSYTGYPPQPGFTPPPIKKQSNTVLIIASVLLVFALLAVIVFGSLYFLRGNPSQSTATATTTPVPTAAPSPTTLPSPTPTATSTATATPIPTPSPTPLPAPDTNFSWCNAACTSSGFIVEYPNGWNQAQTNDKTGIQFLNPSPQDQYAAFKVPPIQATPNASELVDADLQNVFASQTGYTPPTSKLVTTIGGETWTYAIAFYKLNDQKERVAVYATVHLKKGYVIELQANDSQFDTVNTQYFSTMIARFQFLPSSS